MVNFNPRSWNTNPYHGNDYIIADWFDKKCDTIKLQNFDDVIEYNQSIIEIFQPYVDEININNNTRYQKALRFASQLTFVAYTNFKISESTIWLKYHEENNNQLYDSEIKELLDYKITLFNVNIIIDEIIETLVDNNDLNTNELTYKIGHIRNKLYNLSTEHNIKDNDYKFMQDHTDIGYENSIFYTNEVKVISYLVLRRQYNIIKEYFPGKYSLWCLSNNWVNPIIKKIYDSITENYSNITGDYDKPHKPTGNHHHYHLKEIIKYAQKYYVKMFFNLMTRKNPNVKDINDVYIKLNQFKNIIISIAKDDSLWDLERKEKLTIISYEPINHWNKAYGNAINKLTKNWTDQESLIKLLDHNRILLVKELQNYKINPYSLNSQFINILLNTALSNIDDVYDYISKWGIDKPSHKLKTLTKLSAATVDFCITEKYSNIR